MVETEPGSTYFSAEILSDHAATWFKSTGRDWTPSLAFRAPNCSTVSDGGRNINKTYITSIFWRACFISQISPIIAIRAAVLPHVLKSSASLRALMSSTANFRVVGSEDDIL